MRRETLHFCVVRSSELNEQFQSAALDYLRLAIGAESLIRETFSDLALQLWVRRLGIYQQTLQVYAQSFCEWNCIRVTDIFVSDDDI
jgi:hypothetical protein